MKKEPKLFDPHLNSAIINQKLRSNFVEFVTRLVDAEDAKAPRHHRKPARSPKGETPGTE
jgi:hypothetical protein